MSISLEEIIRDSAISIVYTDENYHKASFTSEMVKLNSLVRSLLYVEVGKLREEANE